MKSKATPARDSMVPQTSASFSHGKIQHCNDDPQLDLHLTFIKPQSQSHDQLHEIASTPIFTSRVRQHANIIGSSSASTIFPQYALLGGDVEGLEQHVRGKLVDPRVFQNVAAPSSTFICGSQGSGKSHTLSCILENCLIPSPLGKLPRPLTGIVFHYDTFISDSGGIPCEAAYLASEPSASEVYARIPNVTVEMLRLNESDLNTQRMFDLMAVRDGPMPLYLYVIQRILRELRIKQQESGTRFDYSEFKRMIDAENLTRDQLVHLGQRLDTLENFMVKEDASTATKRRKGKTKRRSGTDWSPKAGQLTIVDLSCPCVTSELACCLFNMCLSLFLEQDPSIGRVIALDEAHKYMGESSECQTLTESLLHTIRLQRHLACRVIISTQEPTVSPKLLDLCNVTVVHRFTSPAWMKTLKGHLAGISAASKAVQRAEGLLDGDDDFDGDVRGLDVNTADPASELFSRIIQLKVGEALLFAPSAIMGLQNSNTGTATSDPGMAHKRLGHEVLKVRIRTRLTTDGGKSIMAE